MSWEQLQDVLQENRTNRRIEAGEPPVACPFDGAILEIHARGVRNCPMGNYRWEGGLKLL
jgi:hypothetical protein